MREGQVESDNFSLKDRQVNPDNYDLKELNDLDNHNLKEEHPTPRTMINEEEEVNPDNHDLEDYGLERE
jgi:hypothetical protein